MKELTDRQKMIHQFIYQFRRTARKQCESFKVRGIAGIRFEKDLKEDISLSYHMNHQSVTLRCDSITFFERSYNEQDMKGRDHRPIDVMSLYDKLDMMIRDNEITEVDFEKLLFRLV